MIARADVSEAHRAALVRLAEDADALAAEAGKELQFEFSKSHVAFILGCNQFLRIHHRGEHTGTVELWQPVGDLPWRDAVGGAVFQMFGWKAVDGDAAGLDAPLRASFERALGARPAPGF